MDIPRIGAGMDVSLVAGLSRADNTRVARAMSGGAPGAARDAAPDEPALDSGDFALELAEHLCALADGGQRGHVVVELHPALDPMEVGLVLEHLFGERPDAVPVCLRDVVAVAGIADIRGLLFGDERYAVPDVSLELGERLALQLEFATVVVLTDGAEVDGVLRREAEALVAKLNPRATVVGVDAAAGLATTRRAARGGDHLGRRMGWLLELSGRAGPPTTVHGVGALVFRDPRPFHPERLASAIGTGLEPRRVGTILRSRGLVRLASRPDRVGSWSSAGGVLSLDPTSMLSWDEDSPIGQEIVFFGRDLRHDLITQSLASCLLTDAELVAGPTVWGSFADPFPAWRVTHRH